MDFFAYIRTTLGDDISFDEFMAQWLNESIRRSLIDCYRSDLTAALEVFRDSQFKYSVPENPNPKLIYNYFYGSPLQLNADEDQSFFWDDVASRPYVTIPNLQR